VLSTNSSISQLFLSLHSAFTGTNQNASLGYLTYELESLLTDQYASENHLDEHCFSSDFKAIFSNIVSTVEDANGAYSCSITYESATYSISQSASNPTTIVIRNSSTDEERTLENASFSILKNLSIKRYIREQCRLQNAPVDLSLFDLNSLENTAWDKGLVEQAVDAGADFKTVLASYLATKPCLGSYLYKADFLKRYLDSERRQNRLPIDLSTLDLSDVNLKEFDFTGTLLGQHNFDDIVKGSGDFSRATLAQGLNAAGLHCFDKVGVDKAMAVQLIANGANPRVALIHYLATERKLQHVNIDIKGIDLTDVSSKSIDLHDVNVDGIQFAKPPVLTQDDERQLQDNFEHDLLRMLTAYSKTVSNIILKSSSKDFENDLPHEVHGTLIDQNRQNEKQSEQLRAAIKTSSGNCSEMAKIAKCMIDLHLEKSLQLIGYEKFAFTASCISAVYPADHLVVLLRCAFLGAQREYIVDPWSAGKAWSYEDGLHYFRTEAPDSYANPTMSFREHKGFNSHLNSPALQSTMRTIFNQFHIKEQLDSTIKENKSHFVGVPWQQKMPLPLIPDNTFTSPAQTV